MMLNVFHAETNKNIGYLLHYNLFSVKLKKQNVVYSLEVLFLDTLIEIISFDNGLKICLYTYKRLCK